MRYISMFSGIEAATSAWHPLGWEPVAFAEIEKFPSAVLAHHHPDVPNLGDITKVDWRQYAGSVDLVCGGSPCQSFSVAGLRKGLADPRGNLALEYLRAVDGIRPRWVVWENVPGVLSADGGRAFGAFLGGLAQLGYGFAYRVLDAQYVRVESHARAVPQRRRRVFVVGHLGDWRPAAAVLLESDCVRGNPAPRREAGEGLAGDVAGCIGGRGTRSHTELDGHGAYIPEVSNALCARDYKGARPEASQGAPLVMAPAFSKRPMQQIATKDDGGCFALTSGEPPRVLAAVAIRRLTPRECERLQGFPDDWTDIPWRGKEHSPDGPRYKAIGNSMAVNVMRWIGERIQCVDKEVT